MRVNEEEIPGVSDVSPLAQKQKKLDSKKSLSSLLAEILPISKYYPMQVHAYMGESEAGYSHYASRGSF